MVAEVVTVLTVEALLLLKAFRRWQHRNFDPRRRTLTGGAGGDGGAVKVVQRVDGGDGGSAGAIDAYFRESIFSPLPPQTPLLVVLLAKAVLLNGSGSAGADGTASSLVSLLTPTVLSITGDKNPQHGTIAVPTQQLMLLVSLALTVTGEAGNTIIKGGSGADVINGGAGQDTLPVVLEPTILAFTAGANVTGGTPSASVLISSPTSILVPMKSTSVLP